MVDNDTLKEGNKRISKKDNHLNLPTISSRRFFMSKQAISVSMFAPRPTHENQSMEGRRVEPQKSLATLPFGRNRVQYSETRDAIDSFL